MKKISRRNFVGIAAAGGAAFASGLLAACGSKCPIKDEYTAAGVKKFRMKFAPRGLFRASSHGNPFKRLKFLADNGFTAVEGLVFCNPKKPYKQEDMDKQTALGAYAKELGLAMGCISSMNEKDFPVMTANQVPVKDRVIRGKKEVRDCLKSQLEITLGVMERLGSKTFIIGPGIADKELPAEKQYENVVENMSFCADFCKRNGVVMEIEPLNTKSHPNMYCDRAVLGARIVRDVNNPHCRLLYDIFHEYMQTGSTETLDDPDVWDCIESFHMADAPSRNEPGTGVIDYKKVLGKIWAKGYRGFIGLEHGQTDKTVAGDMKLLEIYRELDSAAS